MDSRVIEWDGSHLPEELRKLPPGRYVLEPLIAPLTPEEETGIAQAIEDLDAGKGIPFNEVMREFDDEL
jgi:hypothetical protein